eukprot:8234116-Pyramimonas_sp.AAC.1
MILLRGYNLQHPGIERFSQNRQHVYYSFPSGTMLSTFRKPCPRLRCQYNGAFWKCRAFARPAERIHQNPGTLGMDAS